MDNLTLKEEIQVMKAASLAGKAAPEDTNTERARTFVRNQLASSRSERGKSTFLFAIRYVSIAAAACIVVAFILFTPRNNSPMDTKLQNSIHASADSLSTTPDSLKIEKEQSLELTSIDE